MAQERQLEEEIFRTLRLLNKMCSDFGIELDPDEPNVCKETAGNESEENRAEDETRTDAEG